MSSESLTGAKSDDLWCHWFPVSGSLMSCTSAGDGDAVWGGQCKEVEAIPIRSRSFNLVSQTLAFIFPWFCSWTETSADLSRG